MELTKRAEDIIRILLSFSDDHPVSTTLISEKLGISTRSVQREMLYVEQWLTSQGYTIRRKRGSGISITDSEERKKALLSSLDNNPENEQFLFDREQRQRQIKFELLVAEAPIKMYYLTDICDVSEGTLLNDLNQITPWFRKFNLNLIRRTGLGIFVQGDELSLRRALYTIICNIIENDNAMDQHDRKNVHNHMRFLPKFDIETAALVNQLMSDCEEKFSVTFSDSGYLSLVAYMTIMLHHIDNGRTCIIDDGQQEQLLIQPEYGLAAYLANELHSATDIMISKDEICALAMQIGSTRIIPKNRRDLTNRNEFDIHQIVLAIINNVSSETMIDFTADTNLINDLSIHIQPTIGRLRANIPIDNALLDDLIEDYPEIYEACYNVCKKVFSEMIGVTEIPASEVGFITMHFGAAMERKEKQDRRIRVVIVCPTGIGSSRLLAADLKLEYPFLDIVGTRSAFDLDRTKLLQNGIELIISTIKLEINFRYVQVNTIITKHDKALISNRIEYLLRQKKKESLPFVPLNSDIKRSHIAYISLLGDTIYQILEDMEIYTAPVIHNREELIRYASTTCHVPKESEADIYKLLKNRDNLEDTYIKPFHALLLHGRSDIIKKPCFHYIRLEPPFYESGKVILGAIVTVIPESGILNKVASVITSDLVGQLLTNPQILAAMRAGNLGALRVLTEYGLLGFYKEHVAEILELPLEH